MLARLSNDTSREPRILRQYLVQRQYSIVKSSISLGRLVLRGTVMPLKLLAAAMPRAAPSASRSGSSRVAEIGRAHVRTPVTNAHLVCRLLLEKKKIRKTISTTYKNLHKH